MYCPLSFPFSARKYPERRYEVQRKNRMVDYMGRVGDRTLRQMQSRAQSCDRNSAQKGIASLLPVLFSSEYNYTLCEKMGFAASSGTDPFFKESVPGHKSRTLVWSVSEDLSLRKAGEEFAV